MGHNSNFLSHLSKIPVIGDVKEFLDKTPKLFNSTQKQDHSEKNWFTFFSSPKSNNSSSITNTGDLSPISLDIQHTQDSLKLQEENLM